MPTLQSSAKPRAERLDVLYFAGPGDVLGTFENWQLGRRDPSEVSETYSSQFFDQVHTRGLRALVVSTHARAGHRQGQGIEVEHRPKGTVGLSGLAWLMADLRHWLAALSRTLRLRPRVVVVADVENWWLFAFAALWGIRVVADLQCTFWPRGHRSESGHKRVLRAFNGFFWRHFPHATLCISPECERQLRALSSGPVHGAVLPARSTYPRAMFADVPPAAWDAPVFRLMFAGRVCREKGVFELLEVLDNLRGRVNRPVLLEFCGGGPDLAQVLAVVLSKGLTVQIEIRGQLDSAQMLAAYARAHVVVVPTTGAFAEGLNRVVVEGVLSGRPVVATTVCNAADVFAGSVLEVLPGDVPAMTDALARLVSDRGLYEAMRGHCALEAQAFHDPQQSWGAALGRALDECGQA